jgi:hypothetical protein
MLRIRPKFVSDSNPLDTKEIIKNMVLNTLYQDLDVDPNNCEITITQTGDRDWNVDAQVTLKGDSTNKLNFIGKVTA